MDAQCQHLFFYYFCVVPQLGAGPNSQGLPKRWRSFMTDHFAPVEMSWEWGCAGDMPTIRFSIEPIGLVAGTSADPLNQYATSRLIRQYQPLLNRSDASLFDHCSERLLSYNISPEELASSLDSQDRKSRTFVAFELAKQWAMLKAYFLPTFRATELNLSNWELIMRSIEELRNHSSSAYPGLATVQRYMATSRQGQSTEAEIFAIDCVKAVQSRLKIYIRSLETSFDSVRDVMTLGGALNSSDMARGLRELEKVWRLVLGLPTNFSSFDELPRRDHRTAGILYYFNIKHGNSTSAVKVYIPVRHYGRTDMAIAKGLASYLTTQGQGQFACRYLEALKAIASSYSLYNERGIQTYIGCSIVKGQLKLIFYLAPIVYKQHRD